MASPAEELLIKLRADVGDATKKLRDTQKELDRIKSKLGDTGTTAQNSTTKVSKGFSNMGRSAGQAGIQVQQLVGQIQGGTNPMLALSQQAADLGFVLGAPLVGAIAGIGASIAMTLLPSLFETEKTLKDVNKEFDEFDENLREITNNFENMNGALQQATLAEVAATLGSQAKEAKKLGAEYAQLITKLELAFVLYGSLEDVLEKATGKDVERLRAVIIEQAKLNKAIERTRQLESDIRAANLSEEEKAADDALRLFFENEDAKDQRMMVRGENLKKALEYTRKIEEEDAKFHQDWLADQWENEANLRIESEKQLEENIRALRSLGLDNQKTDLRNSFTEQLKLITELENSKSKIEFDAQKARKQVTERMQQASLQSAQNGLNALGQYNKTAFKAAKAFNIAQAIMNTYTGATKALTGMLPPWSYIAAAGQIAFGMAQVAQIRSQTYSGRAVGGQVSAGTPYMVGEQGREVFVPSVNGQIVKNSDVERMGGSGGVTNISFTVNAVDTRGFDELLTSRRSQIVNMVNQAMNERGRIGVV